MNQFCAVSVCTFIIWWLGKFTIFVVISVKSNKRFLPLQEIFLLWCYLCHPCKFLASSVSQIVFRFMVNDSPHVISYRPTFKRIIRSKSTEQFSGLPYIYALLNCLICLWYGLPIVSSGIIFVATVNSVGAVFQLMYIIIFIIYADTRRKVEFLDF